MLRKISGSGQSSDNFRGQDGRLPDVLERRVDRRRDRVGKVVRDERHGQEERGLRELLSIAFNNMNNTVRGIKSWTSEGIFSL